MKKQKQTLSSSHLSTQLSLSVIRIQLIFLNVNNTRKIVKLNFQVSTLIQIQIEKLELRVKNGIIAEDQFSQNQQKSYDTRIFNGK